MMGIFTAALAGAWGVGHWLISRGTFDAPAPRLVSPAPPAPPPEPVAAPLPEPPGPAGAPDNEVDATLRLVEEARREAEQMRQDNEVLLEAVERSLVPETDLTAEDRERVRFYVATRLEQAFGALERGELDRCIALCRRVLRIDARYPVARELKGYAARMRYRPSAAEEADRKIASWRAQKGPLPEADAFTLPSPAWWRHVSRDLEDPADTMKIYDVRDLADDEFADLLLVETIRQTIDPAGWEREGRSLEVHEGALIVVTRPDVHDRIAAHLQTLRVPEEER